MFKYFDYVVKKYYRGNRITQELAHFSCLYEGGVRQ